MSRDLGARNIRLGTAWWTPEQWERLKEISADKLADTHSDWRRNAGRMMKTMRQNGIKVIKVPVDLDDLVAWCEERKVPMDAKARSEYVAEKVSERGSSGR